MYIYAHIHVQCTCRHYHTHIGKTQHTHKHTHSPSLAFIHKSRTSVAGDCRTVWQRRQWPVTTWMGSSAVWKGTDRFPMKQHLSSRPINFSTRLMSQTLKYVDGSALLLSLQKILHKDINMALFFKEYVRFYLNTIV